MYETGASGRKKKFQPRYIVDIWISIGFSLLAHPIAREEIEERGNEGFDDHGQDLFQEQRCRGCFVRPRIYAWDLLLLLIYLSLNG